MILRKIRVSVDLPVPFYKRLDKLEKLTHAESKAGVIRQALQVYEYIAQKTLLGYSFRAINPNGETENPIFFSPYTIYSEIEPTANVVGDPKFTGHAIG
jgi:hypothetical protein